MPIDITAYPYDPTLRTERLEGPEKLRAIEDRTLAALLAAVLDGARGQRSRVLARVESAPPNQANVRSILAAAIAGEYGDAARTLAVLQPVGYRLTDEKLAEFHREFLRGGFAFARNK